MPVSGNSDYFCFLYLSFSCQHHRGFLPPYSADTVWGSLMVSFFSYSISSSKSIFLTVFWTSSFLKMFLAPWFHYTQYFFMMNSPLCNSSFLLFVFVRLFRLLSRQKRGVPLLSLCLLSVGDLTHPLNFGNQLLGMDSLPCCWGSIPTPSFPEE